MNDIKSVFFFFFQLHHWLLLRCWEDSRQGEAGIHQEIRAERQRMGEGKEEATRKNSQGKNDNGLIT